MRTLLTRTVVAACGTLALPPVFAKWVLGFAG